MPLVLTPEQNAKRLRLMDAIKERYPKVAEALGSSDIGLIFHFEGIYRFASEIHNGIDSLAATPISNRKNVIELLFDIQWTAGYFRQRHLRPFTLQFESILLRGQEQPGERFLSSVNPLVLANAEDLQQAIEEKLKSVGVAQRARNRAMAMVALAGGCLQAMQELEAMIGSSGPRLEELRNMLIATERIGWWIGELYPWLHTFATVLVDTEPDSGESD